MKYTVVATSKHFEGKFYVGIFDEESAAEAETSAKMELRASDMFADRILVLEGYCKPLLGDILGMDRP